MVYMKVLKRNQIVVAVIAIMLVAAGYLNYANQNLESNLLPTSSVADSELMASIGDAKLVNAKETTENNQVIQQNNTTVKNDENKNLILENSTTNNNNANLEDSYFEQSRIDREKMYSQMLENYQKILETEGLSTDEKQIAQNEIKKINNEKNAIMIAENLIKTKKIEDVVIFVNNGNVTVIIKAENLDEQAIAQIQNIITRELDVKVNKINITNNYM